MERDKQIIEMYNSGINVTTISNELKMGRRTIYRVLKRYEIPLHKTLNEKCLSCGKKCRKNICGTCNTNLRRYRVKKRSVEYLGGKCNRCNWVGHLAGFDFHHKNPSDKDFNPNAAKLASMSWERVKNELDKCELLCALCHREEHSDYSNLYELSKIYKGDEIKDR